MLLREIRILVYPKDHLFPGGQVQVTLTSDVTGDSEVDASWSGSINGQYTSASASTATTPSPT